MTRVLLMASIAWGIVASSAASEPLTGKVVTRARPGVEPAVAIVYATPLNGPAPSRSAHFTMVQKDKAFFPRVLVVPVGSTVDFPNQDPIFHNVFSLSAPAPFDLGLYRAGASKTRVFTEPATYRVFCNIHPQMTALLVVVPSPYFTLAERSEFRLDVPAGAYRVTVFSERAAAVTVDVRVGPGGASVPDVSLDQATSMPTDHKNKYGQAYPKDAYSIK
jgi:plastocyanin